MVVCGISIVIPRGQIHTKFHGNSLEVKNPHVYCCEGTRGIVFAVTSLGMGHWGTCLPLEFANARKFVVCSVERDIVQQIDIVDSFDAFTQNRRLALK